MGVRTMTTVTIEKPTSDRLPGPTRTTPPAAMKPRVDLRLLIGSGDRIGRFTLPVVVAGLALNARFPARFAVGGPPTWLRAASLAVLGAGVATWASSVALILTKVPRGELITTGPYAVVKHPLYTSVALLVLPAAGFLRNTWLGAVIGLTMYAGAWRFAPEEEAKLARTFGADWEAYRRRVKLPWL